MQIEEQEVHDVAVQETIRHVPEDAADEQADADFTEAIGENIAQSRDHDTDQRDEPDDDEGPVVVVKRAKRRAGIREVAQIEKIRDDRFLPADDAA